MDISAHRQFENDKTGEPDPQIAASPPVVSGADSPGDLPAALGQPQLRLGVPEPRVLLGIDQPVDFVLQRRDPGGIILVDRPRKVDELLAVRLGDDRTNGDAAHRAKASDASRS